MQAKVKKKSMKEDKKAYWENIYQTKKTEEVSWTQSVPHSSLGFIKSFNLAKDAKIIDIGGGDSTLVDYLLKEGFSDITVLDISEAALERARLRLGEKSRQVKWIVSDITDFKPKEHYDLWHDRATFHFLTEQKQIKQYVASAAQAINNYMIIGTFSKQGPEKCSGLYVKQYSETLLQRTLSKQFKKLKCISEDHLTPFKTIQNFLFCSFKKHSVSA